MPQKRRKNTNGMGNAGIQRSKGVNKSLSVSAEVGRLPLCVEQLARCISEPFKSLEDGLAPCLPDDIIGRTMKVATVRTVNFAAGTSGAGYVTFEPFNYANDIAAFHFTQSTSAGTTATGLIGFTAVGSNDNYTFPWNDAAFTTMGATARPVCVVAECAYTGPRTDTSGIMFPINSGNGTDVAPLPLGQLNMRAKPWYTEHAQPMRNVFIPVGDKMHLAPSDHAQVVGFGVVNGPSGGAYTATFATWYEVSFLESAVVGPSTLTPSESSPTGLSSIWQALSHIHTTGKAIASSQFLRNVLSYYLRNSAAFAYGGARPPRRLEL